MKHHHSPMALRQCDWAIPVGYIDRSGGFVIPPQFRQAGSFSEGLAPVKLSPDKMKKLAPFKEWAYIDRSGKVVIPPQFMDAEPFSEGLAIVKRMRGTRGALRGHRPKRQNGLGDTSCDWQVLRRVGPSFRPALGSRQVRSISLPMMISSDRLTIATSAHHNRLVTILHFQTMSLPVGQE